MINTENKSPLDWDAAFKIAVRKNKRKKKLMTLLFWLVIFLSVTLAMAIIGAITHGAEIMKNLDDIITFIMIFGIFISFGVLFLFWPFLFFSEVIKRINRKRSFAIFLQSCLKSGNPLAPAIAGYAGTQSLFWRWELKKFAFDLESGIPLRDAALKFPKLFSQENFRMIQIEGDDPQSLRFISEGFAEEKKRSEINIFALARYIYLFVVFWQFALLTWFFLIFILPKFEEIYADFDAPLPLVTTFLFNLPWGAISLMIIIFLMIFFWGMLIKLNLLSARPWIFRRFFKKGDAGQLLRFLAIGACRNEPFTHIMDVYEKSMRSRFRRYQAKKIHDALNRGEDWISVLTRFRVIDSRQAELLETARRTGNTFTVLNQLALAKEAAQARSDDMNSKIIFAAALLSFGAFVTFWAIAMLSPSFNLIQVLVDMI